MKIFQSTQNSLKLLGIYRPMAFQLNHLLNRKNFGFLIFFVIFFIATVLNLVFEAKTFNEYSESFMGVAVGMGSVCLFTVCIWESVNIFQLIDDLENAIARSKYSEFHFKSQFIEV